MLLWGLYKSPAANKTIQLNTAKKLFCINVNGGRMPRYDSSKLWVSNSKVYTKIQILE